MLNSRVVVPKNQELGALGVAMLAGVGVGMYRDIYDAVEKVFGIKKVFEPREELSRFYRERFAVYRKLREFLQELWILNDRTTCLRGEG
jgi:sugar (pentulose or hexulose) kinase